MILGDLLKPLKRDGTAIFIKSKILLVSSVPG